MADREQPYDPYIPAASAGGGANSGAHKTGAIQEQLNETLDGMRSNIEGLNKRQEHLDSLQNKTDNLAQSAQGFRKGANKVRKQMWWKDMKMRMCLIVGIIILLVIIIVPSVVATKKN